jgi:hypothetical protein
MKKFLLLFVLAISAFGEDVVGKWKASGQGPNGGDGFELEFVFKKTGEKISGTAAGPMGEMPIIDVQVDGSKISFTVDGGEMKILHKGEISGNEMKLKVEIGDRSMDLNAKRSGS